VKKGFAPLVIIIPLALSLLTGAVIMALTIPKNETQVQTQKEQNQNIQATTQNQQQEQKEQSDTIKKEIWEPVCKSQNIPEITSKVEKGDSTTTVSRRAIANYFNYVSLSSEYSTLRRLDGEESVYAEDYIRKNYTYPKLIVGTELKIPCETTEEAAVKARTLSIAQKSNLEKYEKNASELEVQDILQEEMEKLCEESKDLCKHSGQLSF